MGRKRNPYIQLFTRDILSSPRCRALSESAAGVYLFLLCRLNEPPTPGAYRISDWELHPNWKRSCTQQCLATADKQARLQYFAKMLAKNDLPWKTATILGGLQELYKYGIITVEGDMLVQPRMYKDNGFELPDLDSDGDAVGTILDDPVSGSMALRGDDDFNENKGANNGAEKSTDSGTKKVQKKVPVSHAPAHPTESEYEIMSNNNNIDNSIGNKGGLGGNDGPQFEDFWNLYDKKTSHKGGKQYCVRQWYNLSLKERKAAMAFLPQYVEATPIKQYRMSPGSYLTYKAWKVVVIRDGVVVQGINAKGECETVDDKTQEIAPESQEVPQDGLLDAKAINVSSDGQKPVSGKKNAESEDIEMSPTFEEFWDAYDKKRDRQVSERLWAALKQADKEAIMAYIPLYKEAQPTKQYRKDPTTFLRHRSWEDEIIHENEPINNKGYEGSTDNQRGSARSSRGNQRQDNDDMRDQTVRIVQRLRANRQAGRTDEPDTGGTEE